MRPLRPEHGDYQRPIPGAPRFMISRVLTGYAYPVNGNVHNPTPRYYWHLLLDDKVVDMAEKRSILVAAARQPGAAERYEEK
ncbi:hypothetical protein [Actinophytocola sp.]|uniref:hypothetical protein n=1 Tax=Actinophytocola sp. TaxID=1872138 RepID=UPI002D7E57B6|nr:hypothetical protein [Actinophytocola sp.]HET9144167.1 hypothetical protein [Actinophytocola sp.]